MPSASALEAVLTDTLAALGEPRPADIPQFTRVRDWLWRAQWGPHDLAVKWDRGGDQHSVFATELAVWRHLYDRGYPVAPVVHADADRGYFVTRWWGEQDLEVAVRHRHPEADAYLASAIEAFWQLEEAWLAGDVPAAIEPSAMAPDAEALTAGLQRHLDTLLRRAGTSLRLSQTGIETLLGAIAQTMASHPVALAVSDITPANIAVASAGARFIDFQVMATSRALSRYMQFFARLERDQEQRQANAALGGERFTSADWDAFRLDHDLSLLALSMELLDEAETPLQQEWWRANVRRGLARMRWETVGCGAAARLRHVVAQALS